MLKSREILHNVQVADHDFNFLHTIVVYREKGILYRATVMSTRVDTDNVKGVEIPLDTIYPVINFGKAISDLTILDISNFYIKRPSFLDLDAASLMRNEIKVLESVPSHSNIVSYHGYIKENGRATGIILGKCDMTLDKFVSKGLLNNEKHDKIMDCIKSGIEHLHTNGYVHRDLNPWNIMSKGDNFLIVDFDSCCKIGDKSLKAGTFNWSGGSCDQKADPQEDINAIEILRKYLDDALITDSNNVS